MHEYNELELYDIYGMHGNLHESPLMAQQLISIAIFAISSFCIIASYFWYKNRKKAIVPCWKKALDALDNLEQKCEKEKPSAMYYAMTMHLKECMHERYGACIVSKTDHELIQYCHDTINDSSIMIDLNDLLNKSNAIKFGHEIISHDTIKCDVIRTKDLIKKIVLSEN